jgi:hypothetical protein
MDYYNANLKNPKVIGKNFIVDGEINGDIGVAPSKIVAGKGIKIQKIDGKTVISLDASEVSNGVN